MAGPVVSVVIPSYNRAHCVCRAVDSVLGQTHPHVEAIVVDDGSKDGTDELVRRTYAGDPRVRVIRKPNGGVSSARNEGMRAARGEFVALLDSDDAYLPWKLEVQLACLAAVPEAGMIWTDMDVMNPAGEITTRRFLTTMYSAYHWFPTRDALFPSSRPLSSLGAPLAERVGADPKLYSGDIYSKMVLGNLVHTSTVVMRRERMERVGLFDESLGQPGEDFDYHLRTCREGPVAFLDVSSILYLRGEGDQLTTGSQNALNTAKNFVRNVTIALEQDRERIDLPDWMIRETLAEAYGWVGSVHLERGEHAAAAVALARSLRLKPLQPRIAGFFALNLLPLRLSSFLRRGYRTARGSERAADPKAAR
jgi:glycosyltransferase involved in cell wall biosynthesis